MSDFTILIIVGLLLDMGGALVLVTTFFQTKKDLDIGHIKYQLIKVDDEQIQKGLDRDLDIRQYEKNIEKTLNDYDNALLGTIMLLTGFLLQVIGNIIN